MQIIKEYQDHSVEVPAFRRRPGDENPSWKDVFLKADKADLSAETLTVLFNEAKKDFPTLEPKDVLLTRFNALTGVEKAIAGAVGPVSYDGIQFRAPSEPPASYRRLAPQRISQG